MSLLESVSDNILDNVNELTELLLRVNNPNKLINNERVVRAIYLMNYFLKQKLYLAGYLNFDPNNLPEIQVNNLFVPNPNNQTLEAKILLQAGSVIPLSLLSEKKIARKDTFKIASDSLVKLGLGKVDKVKINGSRKDSIVFIKENPVGLTGSSKLDLINKLIKFGIPFDDYVKKFEGEDEISNRTKVFLGNLFEITKKTFLLCYF